MSDFIGSLDPPLGIPKPNSLAIVSFDLPIAKVFVAVVIFRQKIMPNIWTQYHELVDGWDVDAGNLTMTKCWHGMCAGGQDPLPWCAALTHQVHPRLHRGRDGGLCQADWTDGREVQEAVPDEEGVGDCELNERVEAAGHSGEGDPEVLSPLYQVRFPIILFWSFLDVRNFKLESYYDLSEPPKTIKHLKGQPKPWFHNNEIFCKMHLKACIHCILYSVYSRRIVMSNTWPIENATLDKGWGRAGRFEAARNGQCSVREQHLAVGTPVCWTTPLPSSLMSSSLLIFLLLLLGIIIFTSLMGEFGRFRQSWGIHGRRPPISLGLEAGLPKTEIMKM